MENSTKPIPNSSYLSHLLYFVLVSTASNCCLRSAGPWRGAGRIFLWLNFDWPTSSSFSGVIYFFSFPGMNHVAFFQRLLCCNGNHFGSDSGYFSPTSQLTPAERTRMNTGCGQEETKALTHSKTPSINTHRVKHVSCLSKSTTFHSLIQRFV